MWSVASKIFVPWNGLLSADVLFKTTDLFIPARCEGTFKTAKKYVFMEKNVNVCKRVD